MTNYVLVIAHPDDESMFFLPTLHNLIRDSTSDDTFQVLCLSNGNYNGIGHIREIELQKAIMFISDAIRLTVVMNEKLQDGPNQTWQHDVIANEIKSNVKDLQGYLVLITFDEGGVSNHPNHIDTCRGVLNFFEKENRAKSDCHLQLWQLKTIYNPIQKYLIIFEIIFRLLKWFSACFMIDGEEHDRHKTFFMFQPFLTWCVMKMHHSQFVWYRRLFVLFSRYSYWNDFDVYENKKYESKKTM